MINDDGRLSNPADVVKSVTWEQETSQIVIVINRDVEVAAIIDVFFPMSARVNLPRGCVQEPINGNDRNGWESRPRPAYADSVYTLRGLIDLSS